MAKFLLIFLLLLPLTAFAQSLVAPGDLRLRADLQLLSDQGAIDLPLNTWPLSARDIQRSIDEVDAAQLGLSGRIALQRLLHFIEAELFGTNISASAAASVTSRHIRSYEATPRDESELHAGIRWTSDRFILGLAATVVANPFDDERLRLDGSYVGTTFGNWIITAGWQDRWWGPSRDGSLIMSTNARPTPGVMLQRNVSNPFTSKWLGWVGPWTLTSFMSELDDQRVVQDARLFGIRGTFRPPGTGLEIGVSRTAQWCGDGRKCEVGTFVDLLVGNDNRGVNIDPEDEPGNQLGGFDIRWQLPSEVPVALYMQWIGEDGRGGGGAIGSWLRQLGIEYWGSLGGLTHRSHFEVSDTHCRTGGFGFSEQKANCAYNHEIYQTGFRYRGKSLGHGMDGDGLSYSFGSTLVQSAGHIWNFSLRYMEINQSGVLDPRHSLSTGPEELFDIQLSHRRTTNFGDFYFGIGHTASDTVATGVSNSEPSAFVSWSIRKP